MSGSHQEKESNIIDKTKLDLFENDGNDLGIIDPDKIKLPDYDFVADVFLYPFIDHNEAARTLQDMGFKVMEKKTGYVRMGCKKQHFEDVFQTELDERLHFALGRYYYVPKSRAIIPEDLITMVYDIQVDLEARMID